MKLTISYKPSLKQKMGVINALVYPPAVDDYLIATSEEDRALRAFCLFETFIIEDVKGLNFWDYEANPHVAEEAARRGAHAGEAPYDVILLYDVLDHHTDGDPAELLAAVGQKLKPDGRLYVRCHPWCSRHATHLYRQLNKAYLHLVLNPQELARLGLEPRPTRQDTVPPEDVYRSWFERAGLRVMFSCVMRQPTEKLFDQHPIRALFPEAVRPYLDIQFVDAVLSR